MTAPMIADDRADDGRCHYRYNELVYSSAAWNDNLPSTIEAFW